MPEHTPGPWKARSAGSFIEGEPGHEEEHLYPAHVVFVDRDELGRKRTRFVAECSGASLPNDANARLIAAAPRLLEACKAIGALNSWDLGLPPDPQLPEAGKRAWQMVRNAIAGAEGRE